jgi:hypothetical protein
MRRSRDEDVHDEVGGEHDEDHEREREGEKRERVCERDREGESKRGAYATKTFMMKKAASMTKTTK